jgi:hypothetical protein
MRQLPVFEIVYILAMKIKIIIIIITRAVSLLWTHWSSSSAVS